MLALPSKEDQRAVLEVTSNLGGYTAGVGVIVDGEELSANKRYRYGRLLSAEWGQSDIPVTLDATFAGFLPRRMDGAPVDLYVEVDGVLVPQLFSAKSAFAAAGSTSAAGVATEDQYKNTDVLASTAGSLANGDDAVRLGPTTSANNLTEYFGRTPDYIAWDLLSRLPYAQGLVRVQPVDAPILTWSGSTQTPGLKMQEKVGDGLGRLAAQADFVFRDTAVNGHVAAKTVQLGNSMPFARMLDAEDFPQWQPPAPVYPRYFDVCVYTENPDGSYAYKPVFRDVPYRNVARRPYPGQTLYVSLEDASGNAADNAAQLAEDTAELQARGLFTVPSIVLPFFDPLIEREDGYFVHEARKDDDGWWDRNWAWKIATYKKDFNSSTGTSGNTDVGLLVTEVTASAIILDEDLVDAPDLLVPGISGGVILVKLPYGFDASRFWFDPTVAIDSQTGQQYIGMDASGAWVDPALSGGRISHDASGAVKGFYFDPNP